MRKQTALTSKIAAKKTATRATATIVATMVVPAERLLDMASAIVIEIIAAIVPTGGGGRKARSTPQKRRPRQQPFSDWLKLSQGRFGAVDQLLFFGKQMRCFSDLHVFACLALFTRNGQYEAIIGGQ